ARPGRSACRPWWLNVLRTLESLLDGVPHRFALQTVVIGQRSRQPLGQRVLLLCDVRIERIVVRKLPRDNALHGWMPEYRAQELPRPLCDSAVARLNIVGKSIVADIEFGDVDIDAKAGERVQEFAVGCRIVGVFRLKMSLQPNDIELYPGILQIGDKLKQTAPDRLSQFIVALGLRFVQHEPGLVVRLCGAHERAPDVIGTEGVVPWPHSITTGCMMARPERLVDDVPGMQAPRVMADNLIDIGIEECPPLVFAHGLDPGRNPLVPDQAMPAHGDLVTITKGKQPVGRLEILRSRPRRDGADL